MPPRLPILLSYALVTACAARQVAPTEVGGPAQASGHDGEALIARGIERGVAVSNSAAPPDVSTLYGKSYAVVIGIDKYQHLGALSGAQDARAIASILRDTHGFTVIELYDTDASQTAIRRTLGDELPRLLGPDDRVFVYFAGHSVAVKTDAGRIGYVMPFGGDEKAAIATGIALTEIQSWLRGYRAKHVMFAVDACYAGLATARAVSTADQSRFVHAHRLASQPVRYTLAASGADQQAFESDRRGLFTKHLIQALQKADNGDGLLTGREIAHHVIWETSNESAFFGHHQMPVVEVRGEGDFLFFVTPSPTQKAPVEAADAQRVYDEFLAKAPWYAQFDRRHKTLCAKPDKPASDAYEACMTEFHGLYEEIRDAFKAACDTIKTETLAALDVIPEADKERRQNILRVQGARLDATLDILKALLKRTSGDMAHQLAEIRRAQADARRRDGDIEGALKLLALENSWRDYPDIILRHRTRRAITLKHGNQHREAARVLDIADWPTPADDDRGDEWKNAREFALYHLIDARYHARPEVGDSVEGPLQLMKEEFPRERLTWRAAASVATSRGNAEDLAFAIERLHELDPKMDLSFYRRYLAGLRVGAPATDEERAARASVLNDRGWVALMRGDRRAAEAPLKECIALTEGVLAPEVRRARSYCLSSLVYSHALLPSASKQGLELVRRYESMVTDSSSNPASVVEFLLGKATFLHRLGKPEAADATVASIADVVRDYEYLADDIYWYRQRLAGKSDP